MFTNVRNEHIINLKKDQNGQREGEYMNKRHEMQEMLKIAKQLIEIDPNAFEKQKYDMKIILDVSKFKKEGVICNS